MTYENGDKYEGNFISGIKSGFGVYQFKDGSLYEGDWKNGEKTGRGTMK